MDTSKLPITVFVKKTCGSERRLRPSAVPPSSWLPRFAPPSPHPLFLALANDEIFLQIILEQRYGRAVDWWAFGVLIYEMLLGQSPFRGEDEDEIFDAILEDEPLYPIHMPKDSVSILQKVSRVSRGRR